MGEIKKSKNDIESPQSGWKCPHGCNLTPWDVFVSENKISSEIGSKIYWKDTALAIHKVVVHNDFSLYDELDCDPSDPRFKEISKAINNLIRINP